MVLYEKYPGKLTGFICCLSPTILSLFGIIWLVQKQLDHQSLLAKKQLDDDSALHALNTQKSEALKYAREVILNNIKNEINKHIKELAL